jgi:hypothetical protein
MESDRSSALQMWSAFHDGIFKQRGGMTKVTPDTKGLVLLTTLRMKDWRLWNDIIASMATEKHDLPDIFFFDVCEEVLMDEMSFDQITEGWVQSPDHHSPLMLKALQDVDIGNTPTYIGSAK